MNTVTTSFNTTVRQMTEISQWPLRPKCLSKKWPKCLREEKQIETELSQVVLQPKAIVMLVMQVCEDSIYTASYNTVAKTAFLKVYASS